MVSRLSIVSVSALVLVVSVYVFLLFQNAAISPEECQGNSTDCRYSFNMNVDNTTRVYDGFPIINQPNKPVEFDGMKFVYTGVSTPEADGISCDNIFPRAINFTTGHHTSNPIIYDGYFKINETRHYTATFANGQTRYLVLCWNDHAISKVTHFSDTLPGGPQYCPTKTSWFDENKTAGIIQGEYCSPNSPYYDKYVAMKK